MTNSDLKRDNSVMMSSVMPSEKYSCCGSLLILTNGSTTSDGLAPDVATAVGVLPATSSRTSALNR
jgi:hypothetical protein